MGASYSTTVEKSTQGEADPKTSPFAWSRLRFLISPFWFCLLLGIIVRLFLVLHTLPALAGDEATTAIQAENILRGQHPIYYYNQPYMGSLEAYILAVFFAVAGPSVLMLRIGMLCTSMVLVCLTWSFASALADQARLTRGVKTTFVVVATLISALPPLYDAVLEMRSLGGYIEALILTLWILLAALRLTQRWQAQASRTELIVRWILLGFPIGLGLWVDPLVVYAVPVAALWIGWYILQSLIRPDTTTTSTIGHARTNIVKGTLLVIFAVLAALIGFIPAIIYGFRNNWANIIYILHNGSTGKGTNLTIIRGAVRLYTTCVAPRVIGGTLATEPFVTASHSGVLTPGLVINLVCIGIAGCFIVLSLFWHHPAIVRVRQLTVIPFLFLLATTVVYCTSSIVARENIGATCGQSDLTGRYAVSLVVALPFFLAAIITFFWNVFATRSAASTSSTTQGVPSPDIQARSATPRENALTLISKVLLLIIFVAYLATQFYPYTVSSTQNTFKNVGCLKVPSDPTQVIDYMKSQHLMYAFATGWLADPITFMTNESILVTESPDRARIVSNAEKIQHAKNYGFLLFEQTGTENPLLTALDKQHASYTVKRFPTIPGWSVIVIDPQKNISLTDPAFKSILHAQINDQC